MKTQSDLPMPLDVFSSDLSGGWDTEGKPNTNFMWPRWGATFVFLLGLGVTALTLNEDTPEGLARHAAGGVGFSLLALALLELKRTRRSLFRADLISMAVLYYLVFVEFLFPQPEFDRVARTGEIETAIRVTLWSFAGLALGRHFIARGVRGWKLVQFDLPSSSLLVLFWFCFVAAYAYMLTTVHFNPIVMVQNFMAPRFNAPWTREQYGNVRSLFYELGAIVYVVPPLAGIILGRWRAFSRAQLACVIFGLLFTMFYGFTTGTRSIIGVYLVTFLVAYYYASRWSPKVMVIFSIVAALIMVATTFYGLEFRRIGFAAFVEGERSVTNAPDSFFVDFDLYTISRLTGVFPNSVPYLGWEVPKWVLVRVIPRALWEGKPDGLSVSAEAYVGVSPGTTLASTFIGEGYMCYGTIGSVLIAFGLGCLAMWWTRKSFSVSSDFAILLYGSGFFAVVTAMRSIYMLPVAVLPSIAVGVLGYFVRRRVKWVERADISTWRRRVTE